MCIIPPPKDFVNTFFAFLVIFNKKFAFLINNRVIGAKNMVYLHKKIGIFKEGVKTKSRPRLRAALLIFYSSSGTRVMILACITLVLLPFPFGWWKSE